MKTKLGWVPVTVISLTLGGAIVVGIDSTRGPQPATTTVIERAVPSDSLLPVSAGVQDVADLYAEVRPSVVRITASRGQTSGGLGSGIVIDKQGHVLTNNHVVAGFDSIAVTFSDGSAATAQIVGTDPGNDLALIKVNVSPDRLRPARLGDSAKVRVGEIVIAVGNPFGIEGSLTQGIVSGVGRTLRGGAGRPLRQLIQSDAAINPGNSGGALFNARGEVIGVTTAIENPSGERVFVGVGYAVPINAASRALPDMLAGRTVQHPRLGVELEDVTPSLARSRGLGVEQGVLIRSVDPNSGAARAGIRGGAADGDVVIAIDGAQVRSFDELANYIDTKNVGDVVRVKLVRDGREMTLDVTLEAWRTG